MKLKDFLSNPVGKGDATYNRRLLIAEYDSRYDKLIKAKGNEIKATVYHKVGTDEYYVHMVIPTETERDNSYDVVLQFIPSKDNNGSGRSLLNTHDVKFFCNAPSFAYSYAKVFDSNDMIVTSLKNKFPDEIFNNEPEVRNRFGIINYDKYLYFGSKYVLESRLLNRETLALRSLTYSDMVLNRRVRSLDKIMIEYKKAKAKLDKTLIERAKDKLTSYVGGSKTKSTPGTVVKSVHNVEKKKGTKKSSVNKIKKI